MTGLAPPTTQAATTQAPTRPARPVTPASILAARLDDLVDRLESLGAVPSPDLQWRAELRAVRDLAAGLDPYLEESTTPESRDLQALAEATAAADWSSAGAPGVPVEQEMLSGHVEGQLLKMLVRLTRARTVLEVGMFTGYSALSMAEALPADGRVVACELDPDVAAFASGWFGRSAHGHKIEVRVGPAGATLDALATAGSVFDLVFVDADKAGYLGYLDTVLTAGLLAPDGLICVDNTLMQGQPWTDADATPNGRAIADFNARVAADPRVDQVVVPLRDGLTLIRRTHVTTPEED